MPRLKPRDERAALTPGQELALAIGGDWRAEFGSEAAAEQAWFHHRDELLASVNPMTRPIAWWFATAILRQPSKAPRFRSS